MNKSLSSLGQVGMRSSRSLSLSLSLFCTSFTLFTPHSPLHLVFFRISAIYKPHVLAFLLAHLQVFMALQSAQSHIPYRNSKLTHFLKDSLGTRTTVIPHSPLNPCSTTISSPSLPLSAITLLLSLPLCGSLVCPLSISLDYQAARPRRL